MRKTIVSFGRYHELAKAGEIPFPERTAIRFIGQWSDVEIHTWPSRNALETTYRMQGKRERRQDDWLPVVKFEY